MKYNRVKQFDGLMLKEICSRYLFKISLGFPFPFPGYTSILWK